jgi:lysophospholipid acyltransferase (LPLAT)-like uncharacterized protein
VKPWIKRWKRNTLNWLAVNVFGKLILPLLVRSWRVETDFPAEWLARAQSGQWVILAFWHNRQIGFLRLASLLRPTSVLVSRHGDGEIITRIMARFGIGAVRGSSTRGGTAALRQMIAATRQSHIAITPDGPVGPRYEVKDGIISLAALSGQPVFWVSWSSDRVWIFNSWDRFMLPKPFATLRYKASGPLKLDKSNRAAQLTEARQELQAQMRQQTATLDAASGLEVDPILRQR